MNSIGGIDEFFMSYNSTTHSKAIHQEEKGLNMSRFHGFRLAISLLAISVSALAGNVLVAQQKQTAADTQETITPESLTQKASYLIGYNMVKDMQSQAIEFDLNELIKGIQDATAGKNPTMTDEEIQSVQIAFQRMVQQQQQERLAKVADENMRNGTDFLKKNLLKEGVKELENGLQYVVLTEGEGTSPRITDSVKVHYKAMFLDGTVWDTTAGSEPISLTVGSAGMRGIATALQKMKPGDKWKLFIPSDLAFGVQGNPPVVGPNQVVVYEVELVEIMK